MNLFGLTITRTKTVPSSFSSLNMSRGWWPVIREAFPGAWQRNIEVRTENVLSFAAVFACVTLIAGDVGKLRLRLVEQDDDGIWTEVQRNSPFWTVLRRPNRYQNRVQFFEHWMLSKLIHGNTYVLQQRDKRGIVVAQYILDPQRVRPMVAPDGSVFYELGQDNLAGVTSMDGVRVPASEIIHDRISSTFYHPLCGISPLSACGLAAIQALRGMAHSTSFFENGAIPGGIITFPGIINEEQADQYQRMWMEGFSGDNYGKVAVLGNGMTYTPLQMISAVDAQLVEMLKLSAETVCQAFKVPPYKVNVGPAPSYNNVEALDQQYYGQCLQVHLEEIEEVLDWGLGLKDASVERVIGTEFDLDDLMRMDKATQIKTYAEGVRGGLYAPNEGRLNLNLPPVTGGDTPYLQHQDYSLEALAKRDATDDPFASAYTQRPSGSVVPDDDEPKSKSVSPDRESEFRVRLRTFGMAHA